MFEDLIKSNAKTQARSGRRMRLESRYHNEINRLINLNLENRQRTPSAIMTLPQYAFEYCTIKVDIGRQTGKTEYIKQNATKYDAIIVAKNKMKKILFPNGSKADLYSAVELDTKIQAKKCTYPEYNKIYIDEPTFVFKTLGINTLYWEFSKSDTQTYIWLGT